MATSSYDAGRTDAADYDVAGGGWITFSAVLLGLADPEPNAILDAQQMTDRQPRREHRPTCIAHDRDRRSGPAQHRRSNGPSPTT